MTAVETTRAPPNTITGELAGLWKLALPLAFAQAGQALMGMVDTAVLGRLSATAQAGGGLGNSLSFALSYFGIGVMLALDPLVSQAIGAGEHAKARSHLWQGIWLALLTSAAVMLAISLAPLFLGVFGVVPAVAEGAATYMWWRLPGVPGLLLFVATRSYLQGVGRPMVTFWAMVVANVANLVLDLVLVFGAGPIPPLGVAGASIATVLCTWVQLGVLWLGMPKAPEGTQRRVDRAELAMALKLGAPIGLQFIAEAGVFSLAGVLAARLGAEASAAHQVALTWASVTFCVAVGIGSAAATRVGWGIGAKDLPAARRAGLVAFGSVVVFMGLSALVFLSVPQAMAGVMSDDPKVIAAVVSLFVVVAVFQVSDGLQAVGAGALRGAADTTFSFWANVAGHWLVGLPVAVLLGLRGSLGVVGLWWGLSAGLTVVAIALVGRFLLVVSAAPLEPR